MANKLSGAASSVRKIFSDTFNRADQTGIGQSSDGSIWNTIRGSFNISTNKAVGADANYPMVTQKMPFSNAEVDLYGTSQGSAAALWVTDSGNWWAVGMTQEPESCNCTYYYNQYYFNVTSNFCTGYTPGNSVPSTGNGNYTAPTCAQTACASYTPGNCSTWTCLSWNASNCNNYACNGYNTSTCNNFAYNTTNKTTRCSGSYNGSNCQGYRCSGSWNASNCAASYCSGNNAATCATYNCVIQNSGVYNGNYNLAYTNAATYYYYTCTYQALGYSGPFASCSTCYPQYIRVLQSVGNSVSVIAQWSIGTIASALRIKTSGSQLTISAYSDSSMVTQIGSNLVYTPTGVTITPAFGLTIIPSTYNQGYSTDSVEIKAN